MPATTRGRAIGCVASLAKVTVAIVLALSFVGCDSTSAAQNRFVMAADPGSRYGLEYVRDRETRKWVHIHCELRVPVARALPQATPVDEYPLHFTKFMSGAMGTAGISPNDYVVREDHRVWLYRELADDATLAGKAAVGVQAVWPDSTPARHEPMEVLAVPALGSMKPYVWSHWAAAKEIRAGQFAGWEKTNDRASAESAVPEFPFEMRCHPVLSDVTYVPSPEKDPNIAMPDPTSAGR
ncbi:MAG: hypothetical protein ACREPX_06235 [Rhodanobacteraceae bacterium]